MAYLIINGKDFSDIVSGLKVGYETLVAEDSGRNANGDSVISVINRKRKVYVGFRHMMDYEMKELLTTVKFDRDSESLQVQFRDPQTNELTTITAYPGTPEPEYYTIQPTRVIYKPMELNFIEL